MVQKEMPARMPDETRKYNEMPDGYKIDTNELEQYIRNGTLKTLCQGVKPCGLYLSAKIPVRLIDEEIINQEEILYIARTACKGSVELTVR